MKRKNAIAALAARFAATKAPECPDHRFASAAADFEHLLKANLAPYPLLKLVDFGWDPYTQVFAGALEAWLRFGQGTVTLHVATGDVAPTLEGVEQVCQLAEKLQEAASCAAAAAGKVFVDV